MEYSEQDLIELCKARIEEKYHLGGRRLRQRDFEYLLDVIEETSGVRLSVSTLKRLWREKGEQNPHPTTLDALVSILGHRDWLDFKVRNAPKPETIEARGEEDRIRPIVRMGKRKLFLAATGTMVVAVLLIGIISSFSGDSAPGAVSFSVSNTVAAGVPTTVIFKYDLGDVVADTFYIQQDWNPANIKAIDPASETFTSVYYLPGFHRARLVADKNVLMTEEVFIPTKDWLAAALYGFDQPPVYLTVDRSMDGMLSVQERHLLEKRVDVDRLGGVFLFNIRDFDGLDAHNFKSETRFRVRDLVEAPCPGAQFTIHTEANIHFVQVAPKGCVGELEAFIGGSYKSGRNHDLSAFGTDVHEWQHLALTVEDKQATVYLNGAPVLEQHFTTDFGNVVGVDYRFSSLGDVDYLRLRKLDGSVVYEEEF